MTQTKLEIIGPYTPEHEVPFCTRDGWHLVSISGVYDALYWDPVRKNCEWRSAVGILYSRQELGASARTHYIGPALTPTQIAEMLAEERERAAQEAISIGESWNGTELSPTNIARAIAHAIRNL